MEIRFSYIFCMCVCAVRLYAHSEWLFSQRFLFDDFFSPSLQSWGYGKVQVICVPERLWVQVCSYMCGAACCLKIGGGEGECFSFSYFFSNSPLDVLTGHSFLRFALKCWRVKFIYVKMTTWNNNKKIFGQVNKKLFLKR